VLDGNVPNTIYESIRSQAVSVSGVENTEKCRIRKSGIDLFVEMHLRVDPLMAVADAHKISHEVKALLISQNARIKDVTIHIEPAYKISSGQSNVT
jgi:divalent metal cation (Fe/Co/Zn/Cd) transporter